MKFTLPYEKQGYSQYGETGIIEFLTEKIINPKKNFVEIGFGTGNQNMTLDLLDRGFTGIGIDLQDWDPLTPNRWGDNIHKIQALVDPDNIFDLLKTSDQNCDFFSLDIDSFDFEIAKTLLEKNFHPSVICVEINPWFGSDVEASFPYIAAAGKKTYTRRHFRGASLQKYINLFKKYNYEFFTLNSWSYHNGFFYDPSRLTSFSAPRITKVNENNSTEFPDPAIYDPLWLRAAIESHDVWKNYVDIIYSEYK